ncbi:hypothetical protein K353_03358 [Kitasatospora sp. SolWspMP-SS2h]|uniref:hypothetical protein n=1 Tax=Kitasatospora sp. SolWspMP-SS2h TaxID=1305729 RepID=UPI000DB90A71|nr:hypothetical protein [Kitasatospora sp. SolWspMP-SS2h]RAJ40466.1 hypothetical protein K353_03358 [Kitasatospora sp. SolWspMP-SS2h]
MVPDGYRAFSQGRVAESGRPAAGAGGVDRLMVVPPVDLAADAGAAGRCTGAVGTVTGPGRISHADPAVALPDETDTPRHHAVRLAVSS